MSGNRPKDQCLCDGVPSVSGDSSRNALCGSVAPWIAPYGYGISAGPGVDKTFALDADAGNRMMGHSAKPVEHTTENINDVHPTIANKPPLRGLFSRSLPIPIVSDAISVNRFDCPTFQFTAVIRHATHGDCTGVSFGGGGDFDGLRLVEGA